MVLEVVSVPQQLVPGDLCTRSAMFSCKTVDRRHGSRPPGVHAVSVACQPKG